ncbi:MAG: glycosyltransferase [Acidobacteriota bacterium]
MGKIALFGMAPLPFEPALRHHAPGVRTWQLARPLLRAGHDLHLFLCRYEEAYAGGAPTTLALPEGRGAASLFSPSEFFGDTLEHRLAGGAFDLFVGASARPSARAASLCGEAPLWADLFGHTLAEGQCKAILHGSDDLLLDYFRTEVEVLLRADAISTVSDAQELAVLGELGLAGRLNARTGGHRFAFAIPCAGVEADPVRPSDPPLRGAVVPVDAFVALSIGGYNTWADVPTLHAGLERAMDAEPTLHFVSTGGELEGQDHETYGRFTRLVEASRHRERFHLLGWVAPDLLRRCLADADAAVCVDRDLAESRLGSRNRIPACLAHGLTVIASRVSEASIYLEEAAVGLTFPPGDSETFARLLAGAVSMRDVLRGRRAGIAATALSDLSLEVTARPLVAFAAAPRRAPDAGSENGLGAKLLSEGRALDGKDREIAKLRERLASAGQHVSNLEALVAEKDGAIAELRAFQEKVRASLPFRLRDLLRGR